MPSTGFRVIPVRVQAKLASLDAQLIEVGCVRRVSAADVQRGKLRHLSIRMNLDGELVLPGPVIPSNNGPWSQRNANGYVVVRRDLSKETHYNYVQTPNWGDWAKGSHTSLLPYEKYPRDYYAPILATIATTLVSVSDDASEYTLHFRTSHVLDRNASSFDHELLEAINFLKENVDCYSIAAHGADIKEYLKELRVSWELLPPGSKEQIAARLFGDRKPTEEEEAIVWDRYNFLMSLAPKKIILGTSGMQRYFGGMFESDRVVFENLRYGNAVYVMYDTWKELSQRNRIELLSGRFGHDFVRVIHTKNWKTKVGYALKHRPIDEPL